MMIFKNNKTVYMVVRYVVFFIILFISLFAINIEPKVVDIPSLSVTRSGYPKLTILIAAFRNVLGMVQPVHFIAAIALFLLYQRSILNKEARFSLSALIVGGVFSSFLLVGMSFAEYEDFSFITESKYQMVIALTVLIGYWGILYAGIRELILKLDNLQLVEHSQTSLSVWIDQHLFPVSVMIILLFWLPFCIMYFPGSLPYDGQVQLNQFYGISDLTNHHPVFGTLIMGAIVRLGDFISGMNFGIALYVGFQSIVCAVIFGNICVYLRKKKMPLAFCLGCVFFYAAVPTWGAYSQAVIKDTLYYGIFAWFVLEYVKCIFGDSEKYGLMRLALSASIVCLLRNEGLYIAALSLMVMFLIMSGGGKTQEYRNGDDCCIDFRSWC